MQVSNPLFSPFIPSMRRFLPLDRSSALHLSSPRSLLFYAAFSFTYALTLNCNMAGGSRGTRKRQRTATSDDEDVQIIDPETEPARTKSPDIEEISMDSAKAGDNARRVAYEKRWKTATRTAEEVLGASSHPC